MTKYHIYNIEVDSFTTDESFIPEKTEYIIEIDDSYTTFEEREELINEKMLDILDLDETEYSVNCTYKVLESDCDETWKDE